MMDLDLELLDGGMGGPGCRLACSHARQYAREGSAKSNLPEVAGDFDVQLTASNSSGEGPVQTWKLRIKPPNGVPAITSAESARGSRDVPFSFQVTATNSPTGFTAIPALPDGLILNAASGMITGTPASTGNYPLVLTAGNLLGESVPKPLVITIDPSPLAPVLSNAPSLSGDAGVPLIWDLSASPAATQFVVTGLPPGLTLNPATGRISGTPTGPGDWTVTAFGENTHGAGPLLEIAVTVSPDPSAPALPQEVVIQGSVGVPMQSPAFVGTGGSTYACTPLPAGLELDPDTGLIAGTPLVAGEFQATVSAENIAGPGAPVTVRFLIGATPGAPLISSRLEMDGITGQPFSYTIAAHPIPTHWSATPLPAGLSFSGATITGAPEIAGTFEIHLGASNAAGQGVPRILRLRVWPDDVVPRITSSPAANPKVGVPFSYQITASNGPITGYYATDVPAGLDFDAETGLITGTPEGPGLFRVTLVASNAESVGIPGAVLLAIAPAAQTPQVYGSDSAWGTTGRELFHQITATHLPVLRPLPGGSGFGATGLPPGIKLNSATGEIRGIPKSTGTFQAEVWAYNSTGAGARSRLEFHIYQNDDSFRIVSPSHVTGIAGQPLVFEVITSEPADKYTRWYYYSGYFEDNATSTGNVVTFHPVRAGRTWIELGARSQSRPDRYAYADIVVDILPSVDQPVVTSPVLAYGAVGSPFLYQTTATRSPLAFFYANDLPPGLDIDYETGAITGVPQAPGLFTVALGAINESGSGAPQEVTFVIQSAPNSPVITGGQSGASSHSLRSLKRPKSALLQASGEVGAPFQFTLAASGSPSRFIATGLPAGLVMNETTGEIAGVPSSPGVFKVQVSAVNDSGPGGSATLTLTITPATGTPEITGDLEVSAQAGVAFEHDLDATPAALGFTASGMPPELVFDSSSGTLSGTPAMPGVHSIGIAGINEAGQGATATLTLTVLAVDGTPVMTSPTTVTGAAGESLTFQLAATGTPTSFHLSDLPFGLSFDAASGLISGIPQKQGTTTASVWAENTLGRGNATSLTFEISPAVESPDINSPSLVEVVTDAAFTYQLTATNSPVSFNHDLLPAGLSLDSTTGLISGTLTEPGDYTLTLSANNAEGTGADHLLTIRAHSPATFRDWALANDLPDGGDGPLDAPFGDGVKNIHRFAFGLPLAVGRLEGLPEAVIVQVAGGVHHLTVEFTRFRNLSGVTFQLRGGNGLDSFQNLTAVEEIVEVVDDRIERVRLRDPQPLSASGKRFLTVDVELAP